MKASNVVGRGEESLLSDLGPELCLGREKRQRKSEKIELVDGVRKKKGGGEVLLVIDAQ